MWKFPHTMAPLICKSNSGMWTRNAIWLVSSANCTGVSLKTVTLWCKTIKITIITSSTSINNSYSTREKKSKSSLLRQEINNQHCPNLNKSPESPRLRCCQSSLQLPQLPAFLSKTRRNMSFWRVRRRSSTARRIPSRISRRSARSMRRLETSTQYWEGSRLCPVRSPRKSSTCRKLSRISSNSRRYPRLIWWILRNLHRRALTWWSWWITRTWLTSCPRTTTSTSSGLRRTATTS